MYKSPAAKPKIGSKPTFALKPSSLKKGPAMPMSGTTPNRENEMPEEAPQQVDNSGMTPPPGPGAQRLVGAKQFSKPMKVTKKKFNMAYDPSPT